MNARLAWSASLGLLALLGLLLSLSVMLGAVRFSPLQVWSSVADALGGGMPGEGADSAWMHRIILDLRVPRGLLAGCVGAGLALVGVLLQTVTRNDLADPFLFGLSSGAAAGAVAVMTMAGEQFGLWTLPMAAFAGAMASALGVLLLLARGEGRAPERMVLAGLSVSFLFSALTHYLIFAGDQRAAHSVLFWTLGGLGLARWENLPLAGLGLALVAAYALWRRAALDALLSGEEAAFSLGINPERLRVEVFGVCAIASACFVALSGVIGFIGLMVPHLARGLAGALHRGVLWFSALLGAVLLVASDLASRVILAPQELPVGIVTGSLGAVFVMAWLFRAKAVA